MDVEQRVDLAEAQVGKAYFSFHFIALFFTFLYSETIFFSNFKSLSLVGLCGFIVPLRKEPF